VSALPAAPGAYLLAIKLDRPRPVRLAGADATLGPGWYAYAGSARGPGGIAARAGRHLRAAKAVRWHVDRLTEAAAALGALAYPGEIECSLATAMRRHPRVHMPLPGFGASDCRACTAHLVSLPLPADALPPEAEALAAGLAGRPAAVLWKTLGSERTERA